MTSTPETQQHTDTSPKYDLTGLSENQVATITAALELHMRIGLGQLEYLIEFAKIGGVTLMDGTAPSSATFNVAEGQVEQVKALLTGYRHGASKGISHPHTPLASKRAYELYKVLRFELDRAADKLSPSDERLGEAFVLRVSPEEPLAVVQPHSQKAAS